MVRKNRDNIEEHYTCSSNFLPLEDNSTYPADNTTRLLFYLPIRHAKYEDL